MSRAHIIYTVADTKRTHGSFIEMSPGDEVVIKLSNWRQAGATLHGAERYAIDRIHPAYGECFVTLHGYGTNQFPSHIFERAV